MTHNQSELESVADTRRGQWAALYDEYSARVWRYVACVIGTDANAVAEAVQETFLSAAKSFHQFDPNRGTAWAWLSGIAHRQAALHWRRVGRDRVSTEITVEELPTFIDAGSRLDEQETVDAVRRVLAELPSDSAVLLTGKYCDGQSVAALVEQYGGTTESIRSKLARARRDFKRRYKRAMSDAAVKESSIESHSKQS